MTFTNTVAQHDLSQTKPQMQQAFSGLAQFKPVVTSVMHDHHVANSAHYDGRAVDVGAFGDSIVGFNATTWNAICTAIASGQFQKIGTIKALATNPQLQAFAAKHGVELFEDEGSGPHVHFQVAP